MPHSRSRRQHPGPVWRLFSSAGFRFAALFAAVFLLAALAFGSVLWWGTAGALERQTDAAIRADVHALTDRWRDDGAPAVAEAIEERLAVDAEGQTLYLLQDADGARQAGNLAELPRRDGNSAWHSVTLNHEDGPPGDGRLMVVELPDGSRLGVGREVGEKQQLRDLLTEGLAWATGAALVCAIIGAWLMRRALERRLAAASGTAAQIAGGDLSPRVPLSPHDDEFDRLGASMNTMLDRIAQLMDGVRGVSDAIAHDLRHPIARARNGLEEALLDEANDSAALRSAIERGIADLDNVSRVFQAVLRIAEVEHGARRAAFAPLDLALLLADAAELYGASAEAHGQVLETEWPESLPLVGDRDLLLQVLANLLDNAVKFSPLGAVIRVSAAQEEDAVLVRVADQGPGLSVPDRARVGERFFRADAARTTPGSGLGLSLVRAVVQMHGGALWFADAGGPPDHPGLAVLLRLPVSAGTEKPAA